MLKDYYNNSQIQDKNEYDTWAEEVRKFWEEEETKDTFEID